MSIGERIKQLREDNGHTMVYVGSIIGVTKQTLYKYENGIITNIPSDKIQALAKLYNVNPAYIMGWETDAQGDIVPTEEEQALYAQYRKLKESDSEGQRAIARAVEKLLELDGE